MSEIVENFQRVREHIRRAATDCGRSPDEVLLLAVSKTFPPEAVAEAIAQGQRQFGENRVQEAEVKIPQISRVPGLEWHLIGHLQSNKTRRAAQLFDVVHSVDSIKTAARLSQACVELDKQLSILLQVDLALEPAKSGAQSAEIPAIVAEIGGLPGLRLDGLMILPPFFDDPEEARPYFAELRKMRDALEAQSPGCLGRRHLSMGMSHDFEVAIQEGATIVRIGTALFGERFRG